MTDRLSDVSVLELRGRRVDFDAGLITCFGRSRRLTHQAGEVLRALVAAAPDVCTRDELIESIWGGNYPVGNRSLSSVIYALRRALNERAGSPIIKTCPRIGYRLVASPTVGSPASRCDRSATDRRSRFSVRRVVLVAGLAGLILVILAKLVGPDVKIRITREARAAHALDSPEDLSHRSDRTVRRFRPDDETEVPMPARLSK